MHTFKNQIKSFLNFNKRQERGAFVLIVLIIFAVAIDLLLPGIIKEKHYDFSSTLAEIDAWKASAVEINPPKSFNSKTEKTIEADFDKIILNPFPFNPNKLSEEKWLTMGLPESLIKTIFKYESKGGSFKKAEDLQKIYGLSSNMYKQLKDFIVIPINNSSFNTNKAIIDSVEIKLKTFTRLDINRADSVDFLQIPGIGPFYAGQIAKYRNQLGGYISLNQLYELYKVDSSRMQLWLPYLSFKDTAIRQININSVEFNAVLKHPYVDFETAKKIINCRNRLGRLAGLYQLKSEKIISDSLFQKLEPYLKID